MRTPPNSVIPDLLQELRIVSGIPLEKGIQCKELSDEIFNQIGERVSWQSLRRVLGFIKTDSAISLPILDIIARYLGFTCYTGFLISRTKRETIEFSASIFEFLPSVYDIPLRKELDLNYHFVCRNFSKIIYNQPELLSGIPESFLANRAFQLFFIERFPLIDLINQGFRRILLLYRKKAKRDDVAVFVNCLLHLDSYKSGFHNENWLKGLSGIEIEKLHPLLQGRFFGSFLLVIKDEGSRNRHIDKINDFLLLHHEQRKFPFFLFTFLEYAIECRAYDLAKSLLKKHYREDDPIDGWVEYGYREVFKIYHFIVLVETQFTKEAKLLSQSISREKIAFYFRKTFWLMYLKSYAKIVSDLEERKVVEDEIALLEHFLYPTTLRKSTKA